MQGKIMFALGAAVGYVVGSRSGREAYDRLKSQATEFWQDPRVQQKVSDAQEFAKEKIPAVGEKVSQAAKRGNGKKSGSESNASSGSNSSSSSPAPDSKSTPNAADSGATSTSQGATPTATDPSDSTPGEETTGHAS